MINRAEDGSRRRRCPFSACLWARPARSPRRPRSSRRSCHWGCPGTAPPARPACPAPRSPASAPAPQHRRCCRGREPGGGRAASCPPDPRPRACRSGRLRAPAMHQAVRVHFPDAQSTISQAAREVSVAPLPDRDGLPAQLGLDPISR